MVSVVSAVGAAGVTPYHQIGLTDHYAAAGINMLFPLTNGHLYDARRAEALLRAQAESEALRDVENQVTRDVSVAWLNARTAYQKVDLTNQLLARRPTRSSSPRRATTSASAPSSSSLRRS